MGVAAAATAAATRFQNTIHTAVAVAAAAATTTTTPVSRVPHRPIGVDYALPGINRLLTRQERLLLSRGYALSLFVC